MSKVVPKGFNQVIFSGVYFVISGLLFWAVPSAFSAMSPAVSQGEKSHLDVALNENLKAEAILQDEIRAAYRLVSRPHSEYLLYQKSLGLEGARADLHQLRFERKTLIQSLSPVNGAEFLFLENSQISGVVSEAYSGAPMLSFYDGSRFYSERVSKSDPERAGFYRFLIGLFLVTAFSLPLFALYKKKTEVSSRKKLVCIFPIFTVQGKNGSRLLYNL